MSKHKSEDRKNNGFNLKLYKYINLIYLYNEKGVYL